MELHLDSAADQAILTALRTGQLRQGAAYLVRYHSQSVYSLCRAVAASVEDAEDLAYDAFARALGSLANFRAEGSPRTWLVDIALDTCLEALRRAPLVLEASSTEMAAVQVEPEAVRVAFCRLPHAERVLLALGSRLDAHVLAPLFGLEVAVFTDARTCAFAALTRLMPVSHEPQGTDSPSTLSEAVSRLQWRTTDSLARRLDVLASAL